MTGSSPGGQAPDTRDPSRDEHIHELQHRWIRVRLVGWMLIGVWQLLSLVSEFVPLGLERRAIRISAKLSGLVGLILVAYGFERLAELTHQHAHEQRSLRRWLFGGGGGRAN